MAIFGTPCARSANAVALSIPPATAGAQLGPIELLHDDPIGVVTDHVVAPQLERSLARDPDRAASAAGSTCLDTFSDRSFPTPTRAVVLPAA